MANPSVIAIHGVGNRSLDGFTREAGGLAQGLAGRGISLRHAFWGALAPHPVEEFAGVPLATDTALLPDGEDAFVDDEAVAPSPLLLAELGVTAGRDERATALRASTMAAIAAATPSGFVGAPADSVDAGTVVEEVIEEALARGVDLAIEPELGVVLAQLVVTAPPAGDAFLEGGLRDSVKGALHGAIDAFDRAAGRLADRVARGVLNGLRGSLSPIICTTVGDILAYEKAGAGIRGVFDAAYQQARAESPTVNVAAHSLGALVTVEWLLGAPVERGDGGTPTPPEERVVDTLVSFGTQVSVFSEVHGLEGSAGLLSTTVPVPLSARLTTWRNVWHHLDPLAFVMGRALQLGGQPVDDLGLALAGLPTSLKELSFHSSYWKDARFLPWAVDNLAGG